jgi:hypothetical protein
MAETAALSAVTQIGPHDKSFDLPYEIMSYKSGSAEDYLFKVTGFGGLVVSMLASGTGGLAVSMLASGTQVCGFKPGRSRRIFLAKNSSACLPSEGK